MKRPLLAALFGTILVPAGVGTTVQVSLNHERRDQALIAAVERRDLPAVRLLLAQGADANARKRLKRRPGIQGFLDLFRYRRENDAKTRPALLLALNAVAEAEAPETAEAIALALVSAGANVNVTDRAGESPLITACMEGQTRLATCLIQSGADVNVRETFQGTTPLHWVAGLNGNDGLVRLLPSRGANVNVADVSRTTPLMQAVVFRKIDTVETLIASGADVNAVDCDKHTPLFLAATSPTDTIPKLTCLLKHGADVHVDFNGRWLLPALREWIHQLPEGSHVEPLPGVAAFLDQAGAKE